MTHYGWAIYRKRFHTPRARINFHPSPFSDRNISPQRSLSRRQLILPFDFVSRDSMRAGLSWFLHDRASVIDTWMRPVMKLIQKLPRHLNGFVFAHVPVSPITADGRPQSSPIKAVRRYVTAQNPGHDAEIVSAPDANVIDIILLGELRLVNPRRPRNRYAEHFLTLREAR